MSDRELLEAAAKAAGITLQDRPELHAYGAGLMAAHGIWSPLTDDGDALRLATVLGIDLCFGNDKVCADGEYVRYTDRADGASTDKDRLAATRRAIVRAAAALADNPSPEACAGSAPR